MSFDKTAEFCKQYYPVECTQNSRLCNALLDNTFILNMPWDLEAVQYPVHFDGKIDWKYNPTSDREFSFVFNRHRFLINLAQEYRLTADERFLDKAVELAKDWINNLKQSDDPCGKIGWRSLEVGFRMANWSEAFYLLGDSIKKHEDFKTELDRSFKQQQAFLAEHNNEDDYLSNWGTIQARGLFLSSCYLGEKDLNSGNLKLSFDRLSKQLDTAIMSDGVQWEQSSMYHIEVLNCFLDVIIHGIRNNIRFPQSFLDKVKNMALVLVKWIRPNRSAPVFGDSDEFPLADILTKAAMVFMDGTLKFKAADNLTYETAWMFDESSIIEYRNIIKTEPDYKCAFLWDSGNYILRSGWDDNANYLHFSDGFTGGGHAHIDKLQFSLAVKGHDILVDGGRFTYMGTNPMRHQLKSPVAHNTITINRKKFIVNDSSGWIVIKKAPSIKIPALDTEEYSVIGGKHLGYLNFFGGGIVGRTIIWLKPHIYIVCDEFDLKGINSVQRYFNFAANAKVEINGEKLSAKAENITAEFYFLDKKLRLKQGKGYYSPQYNRIVETVRITDSIIACGRTARLLVIDASKAAEVKRREVYAGGKLLTDKSAHGITIKLGKDVFDIIICHTEIMHRVKLDENTAGAGKILLFKNGKKLAFIW